MLDTNLKKSLFFTLLPLLMAIIRAESYTPKFFVKQLILYVVVVICLWLLLTFVDFIIAKFKKEKIN